jgi:transposase
MGQKKSWEITDGFWLEVKYLIPEKERDAGKEYKRKPGGGRKAMDPRKVLEAIFYVLGTGIMRKALPKEFGSSSSVHRYFMLWCDEGVFLQMWQLGPERYDEICGIDWAWLCGDSATTKAPSAQESVGRNPTDRGKNGGQTPPTHRRQRRSSVHSCNRGKSS